MVQDGDSPATSVERLFDQLIETLCRLSGRRTEKPKRRLADLERWSPATAELAREALACRPLAERRAALERLAEHVLAPIGGPMPLEWRTEWEPLQAPAIDDE
jgi:hypothetical protein